MLDIEKSPNNRAVKRRPIVTTASKHLYKSNIQQTIEEDRLKMTGARVTNSQ